MEPHRDHNGDRIDFPESGNDSGSSVGSASSYVSLLDGAHGGSRHARGDVKRKPPALWALAFLTFLPIVTLALSGKLSARKLFPRAEQGHGAEDTSPLNGGSPQPSSEEASEDMPLREKNISMHYPFKHSRKFQELISWVENSEFVAGGRPDWRSAINHAVTESKEIPDLLGYIKPEDRFETVLFLRGRQIRISAVLFDMKQEWDGLEMAKEVEERLLRELATAVEFGYLGNLPSRQSSLKVGSDSTGFVCITLNVSREERQRAPPMLGGLPTISETAGDPSVP